ncbi:MAG TPA: hypothetical protein VM658_06750 [bacterium]|nr:hypothetical protein [bacterium]
MKKKDSRKKAGTVKQEPTKLAVPTYTDDEKAIISKSTERRKNPPPQYTTEGEKDGKLQNIAISPEKPQLDYAKFILAFGTVHDPTHTLFLNQATNSFPAPIKLIDRVNITAALMYGIAPNNEVEAMLGLQMVATHNLAMELLGRAMRSQNRDATCDDINMATKLLRTYTAQMEGLNRNRGKSPSQKVTVEHVHVNEGGQAIVGNVERAPAGRGEEGGNDKN